MQQSTRLRKRISVRTDHDRQGADSQKLWVQVAFAIGVMVLVFACLTWVQAISPREEPEEVHLPFEEARPARRVAGSAPLLKPNSHWKALKTGKQSGGGIAIEK